MSMHFGSVVVSIATISSLLDAGEDPPSSFELADHIGVFLKWEFLAVGREFHSLPFALEFLQFFLCCSGSSFSLGLSFSIRVGASSNTAISMDISPHPSQNNEKAPTHSRRNNLLTSAACGYFTHAVP